MVEFSKVLVEPQFVYEGYTYNIGQISNQDEAEAFILSKLDVSAFFNRVNRVSNRDSMTNFYTVTVPSNNLGEVYYFSERFEIHVGDNTYNSILRFEPFFDGVYIPDLADTDLSDVTFGNILLSGANFTGANLTHAEFDDTKLIRSNFTNANVTDAYFGNADMRNSILTNANVTGAYFGHANLRYANLDNVKFQNNNFIFADLRGAKINNTTFTKCNVAGMLVYGAIGQPIYNNTTGHTNNSPGIPHRHNDIQDGVLELPQSAAAAVAMAPPRSVAEDLEEEDLEESENTCYDYIDDSNKNGYHYLKKKPSSNIIIQKTNGKFECESLDSLRKQYINPEGSGQYKYFGYYECSEALMKKVRDTGITPLSFNTGDYDSRKEYVKIGSDILYIEKPDWMYEGTPPEPRIFKLVLVATKDEKKYLVEKSLTKRGANVISGVHCDLRDSYEIYKLELITSPPTMLTMPTMPITTMPTMGGKRNRKNKRKTLKKSNNKKRKTKKYTF